MDPTNITGAAPFMALPEVEQEFIQLPTDTSYHLIVKNCIMPVDDEIESQKQGDSFSKLDNWWLKFPSRSAFMTTGRNQFLFDALFFTFLLARLDLTTDSVGQINKMTLIPTPHPVLSFNFT